MRLSSKEDDWVRRWRVQKKSERNVSVEYTSRTEFCILCDDEKFWNLSQFIDRNRNNDHESLTTFNLHDLASLRYSSTKWLDAQAMSLQWADFALAVRWSFSILYCITSSLSLINHRHKVMTAASLLSSDQLIQIIKAKGFFSQENASKSSKVEAFKEKGFSITTVDDIEFCKDHTFDDSIRKLYTLSFHLISHHE